jgi:hypothetical protein
LGAQALHQTAKGFFVAAIPAPLALLDGVDQTGLGQDGHVMRDGGLGEVDAFFNVAGAKAIFSDWKGAWGTGATLFESAQDAAARGVGDGMEGVIKGRGCGGHGNQE